MKIEMKRIKQGAWFSGYLVDETLEITPSLQTTSCSVFSRSNAEDMMEELDEILCAYNKLRWEAEHAKKDIRVFPMTEVTACNNCPGIDQDGEVGEHCSIGGFELDYKRDFAADGMDWSMPNCVGMAPAIDPRCPLKKK